MLNQPGYGQIKRADMPINISVSPISNRIVLNKNKPSAFESEYTHRTNFVYALRISPLQEQTADRRIGSKQVPMHLLTIKSARAGKEDAYRQTFIYQTK